MVSFIIMTSVLLKHIKCIFCTQRVNPNVNYEPYIFLNEVSKISLSFVTDVLHLNKPELTLGETAWSKGGGGEGPIGPLHFLIHYSVSLKLL